VESGQPGEPFVTVPAGDFNQISLTCPSGTVAITGSYFVNGEGDAGSFPQLSLKYAGPVTDAQSYVVGVTNSGSASQTVGEYVLCATGSLPPGG
jgi:hypothetical protein